MKFLRYPGGKRKLLIYLKEHLPDRTEIKGNYIEPFVGGGSVFLFVKPYKAVLSDLNKELIDLYRGVRNYPHKVWEVFSSFPEGKKAYYEIRDCEYKSKPLYFRAARTLYLNRTCFKGMWRHGSKGNFNVGYGGEERRWVISHKNLIELSKILKNAIIFAADFEKTLEKVNDGDFILFDPPYKPGSMELKEAHYAYGKFSFNDQVRLSQIIREISSKKKVKWLMTNSSHIEIIKLYKNFNITEIPKGTSNKIGITTKNANEVLISNF